MDEIRDRGMVGATLLAFALGSGVLGCDGDENHGRGDVERVVLVAADQWVTAERTGQSVVGRVYDDAGDPVSETVTSVDELAASDNGADEDALLLGAAARAYANWTVESSEFRVAACHRIDMEDGCRFETCYGTEIGDYWCVECPGEWDCANF